MDERLVPIEETLDRLERSQAAQRRARWQYVTVAAALDPELRYAAGNSGVDRRHVADALSWRFGADGAITWRASRIERIRRGVVLGTDGSVFAQDPGSRFFRVAVPDGVELDSFVSTAGGRAVGLAFLGAAPVMGVGRGDRTGRGVGEWR